MSTFEAGLYASAILAEARELVLDLGSEAGYLVAELQTFQLDVEATIAAMEAERDPRRLKALQEDLERFLPARKAAIMSAAESAASSSVQAALETALNVAVKAGLAIAKAFLVQV